MVRVRVAWRGAGYQVDVNPAELFSMSFTMENSSAFAFFADIARYVAVLVPFVDIYLRQKLFSSWPLLTFYTNRNYFPTWVVGRMRDPALHDRSRSARFDSLRELRGEAWRA